MWLPKGRTRRSSLTIRLGVTRRSSLTVLLVRPDLRVRSLSPPSPVPRSAVCWHAAWPSNGRLCALCLVVFRSRCRPPSLAPALRVGHSCSHRLRLEPVSISSALSGATVMYSTTRYASRVATSAPVAHSKPCCKTATSLFRSSYHDRQCEHYCYPDLRDWI